MTDHHDHPDRGSDSDSDRDRDRDDTNAPAVEGEQPTDARYGSSPEGDAPYGDVSAVRDLLRSRADGVPVTGTYADLRRRLEVDREQARRRKPLILLGAAAAVLLLAGAAAVAISVDPDDDARVTTATDPSVVASTSTSPVTTAVATTTSIVDASTTTTPPSTTTSTPATTVAPEVGASPVPITERSRITVRGLGPIVVPMELEEASRRTGLDLAKDPDTQLDPSSTCGFVTDVNGLPSLFLMLDGTRIMSVSVESGGTIRTDTGLGLGSTEAEVRAAYPGRVDERPHLYNPPGGSWHRLWVTDPSVPGSAIIFATDGVQVTSISAGVVGWVDAAEGCA